MIVRNYTYGAKAPHVNLERVQTQMFLAHCYRNARVKVECQRRVAVAALRTRLIPGLAEAEAARDLLLAELKAHHDRIKLCNSIARCKQVTPEQKAESARINALLKPVKAQVTALKCGLKSPEYIEGYGKIHEAFNAGTNAARAASGVYNGTYQSVDEAARASFKHCVKAPPRFKHFEGHGAVSVYLGKNCSIEQALACQHNWLRLEATDHPLYFVVYLRIDSDPESNRVPVWTAARVKLHRPVPPGSQILWAFLQRTRIGLTDHWELRLTLSIPDGALPAKPRPGSGCVGVNLGWRKVPGGMRVAYWVGSDGREGELVLPDSRIEHYAHPDLLQSRRKLNFNEHKDALAEWMKGWNTPKQVAEGFPDGVTDKGRVLPQWLVEQTATIAQWHSPGRLAMLLFRINWEDRKVPAVCWRNHRFAGDEAMYEVLHSWARQDKHLANWEGHERSVNWRKELYRLFAQDLARRYKTIITEDTNWAEMLKKAPADEQEKLFTRYQSRLASVGLLRSLLVEQGAVQSAAAFNTLTCNTCRAVEEFDKAAELTHACGSCGAVWDQDANAARNSLASEGMVPPPDPEAEARKLARKKITSGEWKRRGREKRARKARERKGIEKAGEALKQSRTEVQAPAAGAVSVA